MGAKKVGVLSRGQRKRWRKKIIVAKKSFVKALTLDEKDKKEKYGAASGDVSKMFEDV